MDSQSQGLTEAGRRVTSGIARKRRRRRLDCSVQWMMRHGDAGLAFGRKPHQVAESEAGRAAIRSGLHCTPRANAVPDTQ